jgi:hypothetical protein
MFLFPEKQGALELTFVIVPVTAFIVRYMIGRKRFQNGEMYAWQLAVFFLAILLLVVFDAMLIMFTLVKNGVPIEAWLTWLVIYLLYLTLMAVAQFPARIQFVDDLCRINEPEYWDA